MFADFFATVEQSDFSAPCITGFGSSHLAHWEDAPAPVPEFVLDQPLNW